MSFASNKSIIKLPTVTRGKAHVPGLGIGIYGGRTYRRQKIQGYIQPAQSDAEKIQLGIEKLERSIERKRPILPAELGYHNEQVETHVAEFVLKNAKKKISSDKHVGLIAIILLLGFPLWVVLLMSPITWGALVVVGLFFAFLHKR